jgi:hypothetical protein
MHHLGVGAKPTATRGKEPIQFDWAAEWAEKVAPYLKVDIIQYSLDWGMRFENASWKRGDAPCDYGDTGRNPGVEGELSWYQPWNRSQCITFFAMAIGVMNYPHLHWRFVTGDAHTVAVGLDAEGNAEVVMDILRFEECTAEESLAHTKKGLLANMSVRTAEQWNWMFDVFERFVVPRIKDRAREMRAKINPVLAA